MARGHRWSVRSYVLASAAVAAVLTLAWSSEEITGSFLTWKLAGLKAVTARSGAAAGAHCAMPSAGVSAVRAQLCLGLARRNTTRIFLYGDSVIGAMGNSLEIRDPAKAGSPKWDTLKPTACDDWQYVTAPPPLLLPQLLLSPRVLLPLVLLFLRMPARYYYYYT